MPHILLNHKFINIYLSLLSLKGYFSPVVLNVFRLVGSKFL